MSHTIKSVQGIEILDSRGKPTVRSFVHLSDGTVHSSSVPSGASTGSHEAVEMRDGDNTRFNGEGVQKAVNNINTTIQDALKGATIDPESIDKKMLEIDGTKQKSKLGANAILAVSQAVIKAGAHSENTSIWEYINKTYFSDIKPDFPRLFVNVINGGKHADWNFDIQEFIISPKHNKPTISTRIASEIFQSIGKGLKKRNLSKLVGDEGGFSPSLSTNEEAFETIISSAQEAGYENTQDYTIAIDAAASEFYDDGSYILRKIDKRITGDTLLEYYQKLYKLYQIASFEDPFSEDDWDHFTKITQTAGEEYLVVGDDLLVTNTERIQMAQERKACNASLIKPNQIGSIYETVQAIRMSRDTGWKVIISHRSGETEDSFIADLAYASASDFIKTGSMSRSERLCKYNRLLEIEHGIK